MRKLENLYTPNPMNPRFMDVAGLAKYILYKRTAIYRMVESQNIPYIRINKRLRFDKEQIDQWMLSHGEGFNMPEIPKIS